MVLGIIIGAVVVILLVYILVAYNGLVSAKNVADEAFSTMDVYLKKRWELVPNLVEAVKGYSAHEKDTLEELTSLRANAYDAMTINNKIDVNEKLSKDIINVMAISENYPDLKASENFMELSQQLTKVEDDIANSRKYYNGAVRMLNNKVLMFPSNIVASVFGFKKYSMFEISNDEKENVKVEL